MSTKRSKVISDMFSSYVNPVVNYATKMKDCDKLVSENQKLIDYNNDLLSQNKQLTSFNRDIVHEISEVKTKLGECKKSISFYETNDVNIFEHYLVNETEPASVPVGFRESYGTFLTSLATNPKNTARQNKYILNYFFSQKVLVEDIKRSLKKLSENLMGETARSSPRSAILMSMSKPKSAPKSKSSSRSK